LTYLSFVRADISDRHSAAAASSSKQQQQRAAAASSSKQQQRHYDLPQIAHPIVINERKICPLVKVYVLKTESSPTNTAVALLVFEMSQK
jgi:hypothetical protein